jgi:hypothetical protein
VGRTLIDREQNRLLVLFDDPQIKSVWAASASTPATLLTQHSLENVPGFLQLSPNSLPRKPRVFAFAIWSSPK